MTLVETKLDAYTNKFRVNQTNFNEIIINTVDNAITKALQDFIDSVNKLEISHAESILSDIKKIINDGQNFAKDIYMNIKNSIKMGK